MYNDNALCLHVDHALERLWKLSLPLGDLGPDGIAQLVLIVRSYRNLAVLAREQEPQDEPRFERRLSYAVTRPDRHAVVLTRGFEGLRLPRLWGCAETRRALIDAWRDFRGKGLSLTIDNPEFESCESPALTFLNHMMHGLRIAVSEAISSEEAWKLIRLEAMLRDTAGLVRRRQSALANESELQKIMHDYLSACFSDFTENPAIGGTLKNFKPDCGITSVGAAIEFKIVHNEDQVATAFSGVAEDTAGYQGSKDWTRFYAVIYQAEAFMLESHLKSDLKRIGAATWTPIVVNGPTKPIKKLSKKAPAG